jgi:hypothetical protein
MTPPKFSTERGVLERKLSALESVALNGLAFAALPLEGMFVPVGLAASVAYSALHWLGARLLKMLRAAPNA